MELRRLMRRLPRRARLILSLRFGLDGGPPLSGGEVARALGVTENRARNAEYRAIAKLRRIARADPAAE
jgi:RNA polymerase primary sigma factor